MITADELTDIRKSGASDDEILTKYRQYDPQASSDIDGLLKEGHKPSKILDKLVEYHKQGGGGETPADPMENKGALEKLQGAVQFGLANLAEGPARTAARTGNEGVSKTLQGAADSIAPRNYEPASKHFDVLKPSTYGYAPRALLESAPGMGVDMGAGATGAGAGAMVAGPVGAAIGGALGFGGSYLARNYGPNLDARMQNQAPGAQPSTTDQVVAGGTTLAEAALNKLGLGGLGGKAVGALGSTIKGAGMDAIKQIPGKIAGAAGREAVTGAVGDVANQVGRTAGTDAGLSVDPHEVANVAGLSGATGGAIRAARGVTDVVQAGKLRDLNPESAARVADEIKQTGVNVDPIINSAGKSYDAFTTARNAKDAELNHWTSQTKGVRAGDDDLTIKTNQALKNLRDGKVLSHDEIDTIGKAHGDTEEGASFHQALQDRNTYNQIAHKGRMESNGDGTGFLAGGLSSSPLAETYLNPLSLTRRAQAYLPGVAGLGMGAQAGMAGMAMAKLAAIPAAAYGGLRALDGLTGNRNPVKQVVNRFGGMDKGADPATLPSARQDAQDAQQASQGDRQQGRRDQEANKVVEQLAQQALRNQVGLGRAQGKTDFKENSDALKNAVTQGSAEAKAQAQAEALRAKQEDAGWKVNDAQSKAEAKRQAEIEKAYAQVDPSLPSKADPEALWAQHEAAQAKEANTPDPDLEAQAGIQNGYQFLAQQALKAQQAKDAQSGKAWSQKSKQDQEAERQAQARDAEFQRAQGQVNRPTPEMIKAAQEDAAWKAQEGKPQDDGWSDQDALAAIQRELKSREAASQAILKLSQPEKVRPVVISEKPAKATEKPQEAAKAPKGTNGSQKPETAADEPAGRSTEAPTPNPETFTVTHKGQTVERPKADVRNPTAYRAKMLSSMRTRQSLADDLMQVAGSNHANKVEAFLTKLNNVARSGDDAYGHFEDMVQHFPEKSWAKAFEIWNDHEPKILGTYGE